MEINDYNAQSDPTLVAIYLNDADLSALHHLIYVRYRKKIIDIFGAKMPKGFTTDDLEHLLSDFFNFIITPSSTGRQRLANYSADRDFAAYIAQIARNFMNDTISASLEKNARETDVDNPESPSTLLVADDDREAREFKQMEYMSLLLSLESIDLDPKKARDYYIWCTHLLNDTLDGVSEHDGAIYPQLAEQLGMSHAAVKQASKRAKDKVAENAKKILTNLVTKGETESI